MIHFGSPIERGIVGFISLLACSAGVFAIDGGTRYVDPRNGWSAFEVITQGDDVRGDGEVWAMPGIFDGLGAQIAGNQLRVQVNHEINNGGATISEVLLDLAMLQVAIDNTIATGTTGGVGFVDSAKQAYSRWSADGGSTWNATSGPESTSFSRFCSGQSYLPDTFGDGIGFVDEMFITGEELSGGRLFALDTLGADLYLLTGYVGSASGGLGGMPADAWENAALINTGETGYVALLLCPDGGTQQMKLYIGEKGKDAAGDPSSDFLARNGLAYGSYYYLNGSLPAALGSTFSSGFFDTSSAGALSSSKLEDIDTSPSDPDRVVLGDQNSGVFVFDFDLDFTNGFVAGSSGFSVTKIASDGVSSTLNDADNVDWTAPTTLGGISYPEGLILINEDNSAGEVWLMEPDGSGKLLIGDTADNAGTESSGVLDISELLGYLPGSIVLTNNQGSPSSLTVLINPDAAIVTCAADLDASGAVDFGDLLTVLATWGESGPADLDGSGTVDAGDVQVIFGLWGGC